MSLGEQITSENSVQTPVPPEVHVQNDIHLESAPRVVPASGERRDYGSFLKVAGVLVVASVLWNAISDPTSALRQFGAKAFGAVESTLAHEFSFDGTTTIDVSAATLAIRSIEANTSFSPIKLTEEVKLNVNFGKSVGPFHANQKYSSDIVAHGTLTHPLIEEDGKPSHLQGLKVYPADENGLPILDMSKEKPSTIVVEQDSSQLMMADTLGFDPTLCITGKDGKPDCKKEPTLGAYNGNNTEKISDLIDGKDGDKNVSDWTKRWTWNVAYLQSYKCLAQAMGKTTAEQNAYIQAQTQATIDSLMTGLGLDKVAPRIIVHTDGDFLKGRLDDSVLPGIPKSFGADKVDVQKDPVKCALVRAA